MTHNSFEKRQALSVFFDMRRNGGSSRVDLAGFWSYPAFVFHRANEVYWLYLVLTMVPMPKERRTALFRPKAVLITKANSKTVVRYDNFRFSHDPFPNEGWDKPKDMYPHRSIKHMNQDQLFEKERALLDMCNKESTSFAVKRDLSDEFRSSWLDLIHPIFLLYLRHITPVFFRALKVDAPVKSQTALTRPL